MQSSNQVDTISQDALRHCTTCPQRRSAFKMSDVTERSSTWLDTSMLLANVTTASGRHHNISHEGVLGVIKLAKDFNWSVTTNCTPSPEKTSNLLPKKSSTMPETRRARRSLMASTKSSSAKALGNGPPRTADQSGNNAATVDASEAQPSKIVGGSVARHRKSDTISIVVSGTDAMEASEKLEATTVANDSVNSNTPGEDAIEATDIGAETPACAKHSPPGSVTSPTLVDDAIANAHGTLTSARGHTDSKPPAGNDPIASVPVIATGASSTSVANDASTVTSAESLAGAKPASIMSGTRSDEDLATPPDFVSLTTVTPSGSDSYVPTADSTVQKPGLQTALKASLASLIQAPALAAAKGFVYNASTVDSAATSSGFDSYVPAADSVINCAGSVKPTSSDLGTTEITTVETPADAKPSFVARVASHVASTVGTSHASVDGSKALPTSPSYEPKLPPASATAPR